MLIWGCHGFRSSYIFVLFLLSCHPTGYTSRTRPNISTWRPSTTEISAGYHWFLREISEFGICVRFSQTCGISIVLTTNNRADFSSNDLLFFCYLRNNVTTGSFTLAFCLLAISNADHTRPRSSGPNGRACIIQTRQPHSVAC